MHYKKNIESMYVYTRQHTKMFFRTQSVLDFLHIIYNCFVLISHILLFFDKMSLVPLWFIAFCLTKELGEAVCVITD